MKLRPACACVVFLACMLCAGESVWSQTPTRTARSEQVRVQQVTYRGGLVTPPLPKPRIVLTDTSGNEFDLRSKTQGYITLLFFGYTHCPDICPLHMAYLAAALKKLPPGVADQIKVVFVTTDPARDTRQQLRTWLDHFDKHFIGLNGNETEVVAAQAATGLAPAAKSVSADGVADFAHAAFVIAYTKDNLGHLIYPSGIAEQDWVHDLPGLVGEAWTTP